MIHTFKTKTCQSAIALKCFCESLCSFNSNVVPYQATTIIDLVNIAALFSITQCMTILTSKVETSQGAVALKCFCQSLCSFVSNVIVYQATTELDLVLIAAPLQSQKCIILTCKVKTSHGAVLKCFCQSLCSFNSNIVVYQTSTNIKISPHIFCSIVSTTLTENVEFSQNLAPFK